ncbi:GlxA family transcriptional regulator [Desulfovibrio caledoniensis]
MEAGTEHNQVSMVMDMQKAGTMDSDYRNVVIFAPPPVLELDVTGPLNVFQAANKIVAGKRGYKVVLATSGPDMNVAGASGCTLVAHRLIGEINDDVDTVLVAGGRGAMRGSAPEVLDWLRFMAARVRRIGSVCTGAFLLAEAGLLDERRATTHWEYAQKFASRYPKVKVDADPIWIQDGNIYTSAGVTSGMDLSLRFVEEDFGGMVALDVARRLVLYLRRPGGQAQFSVSLSQQRSASSPLFELQVWMSENIGGDLSVESLASRVAMSPRNFARVFVREMGITPARYVERLRLEAARQHLEVSEFVCVKEVADRCGFRSAELMRRAFVRAFGVSPLSYREHFGTP